MSNPADTKPAKRPSKLRRVGTLLRVVAAVLAVLWITQTWLLPAIVRQQVLSRLRAMGFPAPSVTVDHVSLSSATLRDLDAGDALQAKLVHVTYGISDLLHGRVAEIIVTDARIQPLAWPARAKTAVTPTQPAATASSAPFRRLEVIRSAIQFPAATGPATIPIELRAFESQPNIRGTLKATAEGFELNADLTSDLALNQVSANVSAHLQVAPLLKQIAASEQPLGGIVSLEAAGTVSLGGTPHWDIPKCRISASSIAYGSMLADTSATFDIRLRGDGQTIAIDVLPTSTVTANRIDLGQRWPTFAASFVPRQTQLLFAGNNWQVTTAGADVGVGDVRFSFGEGRLSLINRNVYGQISSTVSLDAIGKSHLVRTAFPSMADMVLGGQLDLHFAKILEQGADRPALTVRVRDGTIGSQRYQLEANGIESAISILDLLTSPHSPPAQKVTLRYGQMGKWEVRDGTFQFTLRDLQTLDVERTQLGWAGGTLWTDPYELKLASPIIRTRVYAEELDLGKVVWVLAGEKAWAEGKVRLDLPLTFLWPRMRFGNGTVAAAPGGVLHMDYVADQLVKYLVAADPRFTTDPTYARIRQRIEGALRKFEFQKFQATFRREQDQHLNTLLEIQGKGKDENAQALNLNVNVADVDWILSKYLSLQRQTGK